MAELVTWFAVFVRASALLAAFPLFSAQNVPAQVRIAFGAGLALLLMPIHSTAQIDDVSFWSLTRMLFVEASTGLLLGFVCRMIFFTVECAGAIIGTETGLMMSSQFNPLNSSVSAIPGVLLYWLTIVLMFGFDLHHALLIGFERSYALVPIGAAHLNEALLVDVIGRTARMFGIAVQMTAPVIAVSFVVTAVFSMLGRVVPQMNVFAESFPVRTMVGLTVFGVSCTLMAEHISNYLRRLPEDMLRVSQLLGGT